MTTTDAVEPNYVLIVDDQPDLQSGLVGELRDSVNADVQHPEDLDEETLKQATLVAVDQRLDSWPERDNLSSVALQPLNGLALTAVLRARVESLKPYTPTAFAVYTAHPEDLAGAFPADSRSHAIARAHNLEWVFAKSDTLENVVEQMTDLAAAVAALPTHWPRETQDSARIAANLLKLPADAPWADRAWTEVEACHPPLHELSESTHGMAFLRWLLHRILPYPCFLWDERYVAARLRVTHKSLQTSLRDEEALRIWLGAAQYRGILGEFIGARWWRAGVEALLWTLTKGNPFEPGALKQHLGTLSASLDPVDLLQPVVCLDHNYKPLPAFADIQDAVQIQPDDWPPYADGAWTTLALARDDPALRSLVLSEDRERVSPDEPSKD